VVAKRKKPSHLSRRGKNPAWRKRRGEEGQRKTPRPLECWDLAAPTVCLGSGKVEWEGRGKRGRARFSFPREKKKEHHRGQKTPWEGHGYSWHEREFRGGKFSKKGIES